MAKSVVKALASDHYLVVLKMHPKLSIVSNIRYRRPPLYNLTQLMQADAAESYAQSLKGDALDEVLLKPCRNTVKTPIDSAAGNILGHVERFRRNEWFDEKCQQVLDEKNAARELMLRYATRQNEERCNEKRQQQTRLFREKNRRKDKQECEELEQLHRSRETQKFYRKLNMRIYQASFM